jgi:metallophosphoesterase (TIGR03767 family)
MRRLMLGALVAALGCTAGEAQARPATTLVQTIVDRNGDNLLDTGPGEAHVLRQDLGVKSSVAAKKKRNLAFFAQLTDTHVVDEESPLRVEFTDKYGAIFTSAYRPQEGLSAQVMNEMVEQVRNTNSPVDGRNLELVMTTGDNTDNTQCNETRWMVDLMDGEEVDPDSGLDAPKTFTASELCIAPTSAPAVPTPPGCDITPNGTLYDGVRGGGEYYEPDSSEPGEDGPGYRPDQGAREIRDFPGLFEEMNQPFDATGFDDLPWYGIFGNHDGLIQGNAPRNPALEAYAVGCLKVKSLSEDPTTWPQVMSGVLGETPATTVVPPDQRRRPLRKQEYIAEHFKTTGTPVGHGFDERNLLTGEGNYAFSPKPGLRFIVLDTIAEGGLEAGNIDDPQFQWLHQELLAADQAKQLAVVFGHHSIRTMGQPPVSPFPYGDTGGNLTPLVHFGDGPRETGVSQPCLTTQGTAPTYPTETVRCLLLRHKSVIAFVNGHEHANRVDAFERAPGTGPAQGGFWEINTASHIDWPQQSRVLDIVDNGDKTISIYGTIVDHAAPPNPGGSAATDSVTRLASISRELSFNDPHAAASEDGEGGARGSREDRNVELVVRDPR